MCSLSECACNLQQQTETASFVCARLQARYAAVRRQTAPKPGLRETQVLDYQNVSAELLPLVGAAYALKFMGQVCMPAACVAAYLLPSTSPEHPGRMPCGGSCLLGARAALLPCCRAGKREFSACRLQAGMADYRRFEEGRDAGDFSMLPELHASLSALKVHLS